MKLVFFLSLVLLIFVGSCKLDIGSTTATSHNAKEFTFDSLEMAVLNHVGVDPQVAKVFKNTLGGNVRYLMRSNEYNELNEFSPLGFFMSNYSGKCSEALFKMRSIMDNDTIHCHCYSRPDNSVSLAVLKTSSKFQILRERGVQAYNSDMDTEDLIKELTKWQSDYEFYIANVDFDSIDLWFETPPEQTQEFKNMVTNFCGDVADWLNDSEYVFLMEEDSNHLNLWWD